MRRMHANGQAQGTLDAGRDDSLAHATQDVSLDDAFSAVASTRRRAAFHACDRPVHRPDTNHAELCGAVHGGSAGCRRRGTDDRLNVRLVTGIEAAPTSEARRLPGELHDPTR